MTPRRLIFMGFETAEGDHFPKGRTASAAAGESRASIEAGGNESSAPFKRTAARGFRES